MFATLPTQRAILTHPHDHMQQNILHPDPNVAQALMGADACAAAAINCAQLPPLTKPPGCCQQCCITHTCVVPSAIDT
jgi:hypothetical protein